MHKHRIPGALLPLSSAPGTICFNFFKLGEHTTVWQSSQSVAQVTSPRHCLKLPIVWEQGVLLRAWLVLCACQVYHSVR